MKKVSRSVKIRNSVQMTASHAVKNFEKMRPVLEAIPRVGIVLVKHGVFTVLAFGMFVTAYCTWFRPAVAIQISQGFQDIFSLAAALIPVSVNIGVDRAALLINDNVGSVIYSLNGQDSSIGRTH